MAYLISHIAISLIFAQLLGLLLGWLLWGYAARTRGKDVQSLRNRIADMQLLSTRAPLSHFPHSEPRMGLPDFGHSQPNTLIEGELPERAPRHNAFFEDEEPEADSTPETIPLPTPVAAPILPIAPDLEAEVKEARLQHLQQQVRELESMRERMPLLQADLTDAIAGRRTAESRFQEAKSDFEVRSSSLLSQIKDFESTAVEWERAHEHLELDKIAAEKELASVKATLRDVQNSQRPQTVDALAFTPTASAIELADLRERYQRALKERDSVAAELEFWKQSDGDRPSDSMRLVELEEATRSKDSQLAEQAARVESLLWHVAELEPFATEAPQKDEDLRRQESEIAGHMAMHSENAERIRSLQNHIGELESSTVPTQELDRIAGDHQAEVQRLTAEQEQRLIELQKSLAMKDDEISEHVSARYAEVNLVNSMQARITELETSTQRMAALEKLVVERDTEIRGLLSAHSEIQREMDTWKARTGELEPLAAGVPALKASLDEHAVELMHIKESHGERERQLKLAQERLAVLTGSLTAQQHRIQALEPLASKTPELERSLVEQEQETRQRIKALEERHQNELIHLKVNSAQRVRRLRQSMTNIRG